jgi:trimethylamine--corrinoid protein Co-methyltransferase
MFLAHGVLCNVGPCGIAGATAPYPVAGIVVQSWAEFLAMVVAAQVIEPGAPVVGGGGGAHHLDMQSGESIYSGISKSLASAAMNELCAGQDLPVATGNLSTLCSNYGVQNGLESALGAFATFFGRANNYGSFGSLANACGMSAVQIVLHHDLIEMLERFRRGIDTSAEKLAVESILATGPRGDFLMDPLTLKYLRSDEHFFAPCFEQCAGTQDEKTMAERAHARAEELIATHQPAVPEDRLEEVHRYVERELARLREGE